MTQTHTRGKIHTPTPIPRDPSFWKRRILLMIPHLSSSAEKYHFVCQRRDACCLSFLSFVSHLTRYCLSTNENSCPEVSNECHHSPSSPCSPACVRASNLLFDSFARHFRPLSSHQHSGREASLYIATKGSSSSLLSIISGEPPESPCVTGRDGSADPIAPTVCLFCECVVRE